MQSIKVNILGKQIPLKVKDDEVEKMKNVAAYVDDKFRVYRKEVSNQPDSIVMILASLSIAEELYKAHSLLEEYEKKESEAMESVNKQLETVIKEIF